MMNPKNKKEPDSSNPRTARPFSVGNRKALLAAILIIALGFSVYGNSLNGKFIWDDDSLVVENAHIKDAKYLPQIFSESIGAGFGKEYNFYRPLQIATYMIDYFFWKLDPRGYHLTNILLHIFAALTLYGLVNAIFRDSLLSLLTGVLFVVHPIHTETVSYISGRADSLSVLFMLLCFLLYMRGSSRNTGMLILMLLSYSAALLSKEGSLILPALLLLYHYSFKEKLNSKAFFSIAGLASVYLLVRVTVLKGLLANDMSTTTLLERLPGVFVSLTTYIRLLVFPLDLHMEYGSKLFTFRDPRAICGIILLMALLFCALRKREDNKLVFFCVAWFFIALLPVLNLYPVNANMAEHWLYLPSIGFFVIIAKTICVGATGRSPLHHRIKNLKNITVTIAICLLGFYSYLTVKQNGYWREPLIFYERTLTYAPDSSRLYSNLGVAYSEIDRNEDAIAAYQKAIGIEKDYEEAYYNLGAALSKMNKKEEAIAAYQKAIELKGDYAQAYYNLGVVLSEIDKNEEAVAAYQKAIEINPNYGEAYNNLGVVYGKMDRKEEALAAYQRSIEIGPDSANVYNNLGALYGEMNRKEEAIAAYQKAIELKTDYAEAYYNLGVALNEIGRTEDAVAAYKKAIEIRADFSEAYNNLGFMYSASDQSEETIALFSKAIETDPDSANAYNNLGNVYNDMGRKKEAMEFYEKAVKIDPGYVPALNSLGVLYNEANRREDAIALFKKAIEISPDDAQSYNNLGVAYAAMNRKEEAAASYKKAIEINPDYANAHYSLGNVYRAMGEFDEAIASYKEAIRININDAEAHHDLAAVYYEQKQYASAIDHYDQAERLGYKDAGLAGALAPHR